jgi:hypothetical protein
VPDTQELCNISVDLFCRSQLVLSASSSV